MMKKAILFVFALTLVISLTNISFAQEKEKKENDKTTKVETNNTDPQFNEVVSVKEGTPVNSVCPVSGEDLDDDQQLVKYQGEIIGVCCKKCLKKVKADPEKYFKRLKRDDTSGQK